MRLPTPNLKTLGKVAVGGTVVGVGAAALAGALPGTEGVASGFANGVGDVFNGATSGLAGILQMSPMLLVGGGLLALLVLLK